MNRLRDCERCGRFGPLVRSWQLFLPCHEVERAGHWCPVCVVTLPRELVAELGSCGCGAGCHPILALVPRVPSRERRGPADWASPLMVRAEDEGIR